MRNRLVILLVGIAGVVLITRIFRVETHRVLRDACYGAAPRMGGSLVCRLSTPARDDALRRAVQDSNGVAASAIIAAGADPSSNGDDALWSHTTPLSIAVFKGDVTMAELLLGKGANPNRPGEDGLPLALAISRGDEAMVYLLLERGADPFGRSWPAGKVVHPTPLEAARAAGNHKLEAVFVWASSAIKDAP